MRKILFTTFMLLSTMLVAQEQVQFYPVMSDPLQAVFCDYASAEGEVRYVSNNHGQYVGNFIDNKI